MENFTSLPTLSTLDLKGKRALIRVDFNVPLDNDGNIADDSRIKAALPTIEYVLQQGAKVILMSHFGRPEKKDPHFSLKPCARRLSELLKKPVLMAEDSIGEKVQLQVAALQPGDVLLLENLRFYPAEEKPERDPTFAKNLGSLGDCYINDAFGAAHRAHSSIVPIASLFSGRKAAGLLLEKEIQYLSSILQHPKRPFYALIGGAKVSTKIGVLKSLLSKVDALFIGGAMAFTFLKAAGKEIGNSLFEENFLQEARTFLEAAEQKKTPLFLPIDIVTQSGIVTGQDIPKNAAGLDIGPETITLWSKELQKAQTIFWNGPLGKFEEPAFAKGTEAIAKAIASLQETTTVAGGGETIQAIIQAGVEKKFSHLSTGGGASLEFLEYGTLPGIEALK